jgi:hypothetical protein
VPAAGGGQRLAPLTPATLRRSRVPSPTRRPPSSPASRREPRTQPRRSPSTRSRSRRVRRLRRRRPWTRPCRGRSRPSCRRCSGGLPRCAGSMSAERRSTSQRPAPRPPRPPRSGFEPEFEPPRGRRRPLALDRPWPCAARPRRDPLLPWPDSRASSVGLIEPCQPPRSSICGSSLTVTAGTPRTKRRAHNRRPAACVPTTGREGSSACLGGLLLLVLGV